MSNQTPTHPLVHAKCCARNNHRLSDLEKAGHCEAEQLYRENVHSPRSRSGHLGFVTCSRRKDGKSGMPGGDQSELGRSS